MLKIAIYMLAGWVLGSLVLGFVPVTSAESKQAFVRFCFLYLGGLAVYSVRDCFARKPAAWFVFAIGSLIFALVSTFI
jgi:hypothetical protein